MLLQRGVMGVNPNTGGLLWHHENTEGHYWDMTPLWIKGDILIVASGEGTHAIRLMDRDGKTVPERLWSSRKLRFPQNNPVKIGNYICGSSGSVYRRATMVCAEIETGKRLWAERGFALATCVLGDGKLIILDENGKLGIASMTPDGLTVHSSCQITARESWTAPTLVGQTLYVRDRRHIMALDLS
jgi:outer membrane protein assembly factor BamB